MAIQVTGTLLDACVLALLAEGDAYGYSLTQSIRGTLDVSESTMYPVMRRLQTDECLTAYDEPHSGRNRRYYRITERGLEKFMACVEEWKLFKQRIDSILGGGDNSGSLGGSDNLRGGNNSDNLGGSDNLRGGDNSENLGGGDDDQE